MTDKNIDKNIDRNIDRNKKDSLKKFGIVIVSIILVILFLTGCVPVPVGV